MEQLAALTAETLFDHAISQYVECEENVDGFNEMEPETHFDKLLICLDLFLTAAEDSDYIEDMEDALAAVVGACVGIAVSSGFYQED